MSIGSFRWHGVTVKRGQAVVVSPSGGSVTQADGDTVARCGAKTRAGGTCMVRVEFGKARCRFHGGLSTGPKTEAGPARIVKRLRSVAIIDVWSYGAPLVLPKMVPVGT